MKPSINKKKWMSFLFFAGIVFNVSPAQALQLDFLASVAWYDIVISNHNQAIDRTVNDCENGVLTQYEYSDIVRSIDTETRGLISVMRHTLNNQARTGQDARNQLRQQQADVQSEIYNGVYSGNGSSRNNCASLRAYMIRDLWALVSAANQ